MKERPAPVDFPALYDAYFDRVYGYILLRVRDRGEADDVVGKVFERALDGFGGYRPDRGSLEVWLFAIARNAVRDHFNSWWRRQSRPLGEPEDFASPAPGVDAGLEADEERGRLLRALSKLDERGRDVLGLRFQAALTNRQVGEVMGLEEGHVGVLVHRAIGKLKEILKEETSS